MVEDPDNDFPNDFTLNVLPGDLYSVSGNTVLPSADFTGTLTVSVYVNDGTDDSEPFNISLEVFKALELESATSNTWEVYPNPTKDWLIIKSNNLSDAFQIKIYGMNGELIKGLEQITSVNHTIDLSSLQPGMYLLQILDGAKEHTVRFMKRVEKADAQGKPAYQKPLVISVVVNVDPKSNSLC